MEPDLFILPTSIPAVTIDLHSFTDGNGAAFASSFAETAIENSEEAIEIEDPANVAVPLHSPPGPETALPHATDQAESGRPIRQRSADETVHPAEPGIQPDLTRPADPEGVRPVPAAMVSQVPTTPLSEPAQLDTTTRIDRPAPATIAHTSSAFSPAAIEPKAPDLRAGGLEHFSAATSSSDLPALPQTPLSVGPSASPATLPTPLPASIAPGLMEATHSLMIAAPSDVVDILTQSLSQGENRKERIIVQLDPPELGRVSIDFKFDAQGVQHVTITGETPEALRQLRLMHFELIQALERHGLAGQDMTFRQHQPQQDTHAGATISEAENETSDASVNARLPVDGSQQSESKSTSPAGLNIKL